MKYFKKNVSVGRVKASSQNKWTLIKLAGWKSDSHAWPRELSLFLIHTEKHALTMTKPCTHLGVDTAAPTPITTVGRWTVMISWLIANSFLFLSSLG